MATPLRVSYPPFVRRPETVTFLHFNILLALLPALGFGYTVYGLDALRVAALSMGSAVLFEAGIRRLFGRQESGHDLSALVNGLLLAFLLPAGAPAWLVLMGSFIMILVGKQIFGGLGFHPLNPALIGWAVLRLSWPDYLDYNLMLIHFEPGFSLQDPLVLHKLGGTASVAAFSLHDLFLGKQAGGVGSSSVVWLLMGGGYLLVRRVISWRIPFSFLTGLFVCAALFHAMSPEKFASPIFQLLAGSGCFAAFFLATDFSSSPNAPKGRLLFGFLGGMMTMVFRAWSVYPDGTVFALLILSLFTPFFDRLRSHVRYLRKVTLL